MAFSILTGLVRRGLLELAHVVWRPFADSPIQVEQYPDGDSYIVRAELPGLDPDRDIHVALLHGELRIRAERTADRHDSGRSDFRYGMFYRGVPLPRPVRVDAVDARYDRGILEIRIGLDFDRQSGHGVPVPPHVAAEAYDQLTEVTVAGTATSSPRGARRDQRHEHRSRTTAAAQASAGEP